MDFELRATPASDLGEDRDERSPGAGFAISAAPLIASEPTPEISAVPEAKGTPTLCLMARDPHTLFAYWDIDWASAFGDEQPRERTVHLRVLKQDGAEQRLDVEPMAGSCYISVETADAAYSAEIGFYGAGQTWNAVATSELISTPPDQFADGSESDFATVPFHLSFQRMIDMLRSSRSDETPLIAKLAELRERAGNGEAAQLTAPERELASAIEHADASEPQPAVSKTATRDLWNRQRLERLLGFGATSPTGGFGGSSRGSV